MEVDPADVPAVRESPGRYSQQGEHSMKLVRGGIAMITAGLVFSKDSRRDRNLEWDAGNLRFSNDADASALINLPYQDGSSLHRV